MKQGYTLVELMVAITITGIMISFGISAYAKGRDRQAGRAAGEQLISFLTENQKKANIGNKDCAGKYLGQAVSITTHALVTSLSQCTSTVGTPESITIADVTSITAGSILFKPLSQGSALSSDPLNLDYTTSSGTTFRVQVTSSGTIEYKGLLP